MTDRYFGDLLRQHRERAGLSQEELATAAGLSVRAVSDMERGRTSRPHGRSVRLLAEALKLPAAAQQSLIRAARNGAQYTGTAGGGIVGPVPVPRQLPAAPGHFAGRRDKLKVLDGLLERAPGAGRAFGAGLRDHRDRRGGQDRAGGGLGAQGVGPFPGRAAVRGHARVRSIRRPDVSRRGHPQLPRRAGGTRSQDSRGGGRAGELVPDHAGGPGDAHPAGQCAESRSGAAAAAG